jgi:3-oxoacyl-(acyl-carrier-protein) synthase
MNANLPSITGFGSVSPFGATAGLLSGLEVEPEPIAAWPNATLRRAYQVQPFNPAKLVPGVKTRRLDRLSCWALVAASLALQDAGVNLDTIDRSRVAVLFASGFGCVELTESFYRSAALNGWTGTDPITFPETLANAPACHVALFHGLRGPNLTLGGENFAAEIALLRAASLLRHGQADRAIVIAGDALSPAVYQWYETAGLLSPACFVSDPPARSADFVPSEGVAALLLESGLSTERRGYAQFAGGRYARSGDSAQAIRHLFPSVPSLVFSAGNGGPCSCDPPAGVFRSCAGQAFSSQSFSRNDARIVASLPVADGLARSGGLFHLLLALSRRPGSGSALMLGTAAGGAFAALRLEVPSS